MSFVNIPVMGSAQDLRRQLRYSASRRPNSALRPKLRPGLPDRPGPTSDSGYDHDHLHILDDQPSLVNVPNRKSETASLLTQTASLSQAPATNTSGFVNNNNHSSSAMSDSSRVVARVRGSADDPSDPRQSNPSLPASRNHPSRESDRASQYSHRQGARRSNQHRDSHSVSVARKPSSVARSTTDSRRQRAPSAHSRSRPLSPYRSLALPDEPEITRNFPNSDPNVVTNSSWSVPSGFVAHVDPRMVASHPMPSRTAGKATTSISMRSTRPSVSRHSSRPTPAIPSSSVSIAHQNHSSSHPSDQHSLSRTRNGAHLVSASGSKPMMRSPSISGTLSPSNIHGEVSPSAATVDSNAGPRLREGHPIPGLVAEPEGPEPQMARNRSQSRMPQDQSVTRGRSLQRGSAYRSQGSGPNQVQSRLDRSRSPAFSHSADQPPPPPPPPRPPPISGSAVMPMPAPTPVPTTISQALSTSIPRETNPREGAPFPGINRRRVRQIVGNYMPNRRKLFRANKFAAQVEGRSQDDYPTRPVHPSRSHIINNGNIPDRSTPLQNDRSSPAIITRRPSRHSNLGTNPNQRGRSAGGHSTHSKRSRRSRSRQSRRSHVSPISMRDVNARASSIHAPTNGTLRKKPLRWKWPTTTMGKLFSSNSGLPSEEKVRVVRPAIPPETEVPVQEGHKRSRVDSNLSMNWNLPQIKKLTAFNARFRDSPTVQTSSSHRPDIHLLLRTPTLFRPARLHWDVRNLTLPLLSKEDTTAMLKLLKEPATSPPTTHMRLLLRSPVPRRRQGENPLTNPKYWEVEITPSSLPTRKHPQPYIKCMDVIRAFGKMLRTPADASEFDSLDDMHQRLTIRVFEMRAAGVFGPQSPGTTTDVERVKAREMRKGYRKVDLLVNQTRWDGLQSTKANSNEWIVKLGRVPLNPF